jgi:exopolysaccharide production protein ExoZ
MKDKPSNNTVYSIQALRALAAWHVVAHHFVQLIPGTKTALGYGVGWYFASRGSFGVDIFFVISGFIMMASTSHDDIKPANFFLRRIFRIVPAYWFFTLILASLSLLHFSAFSSVKPDGSHILQSMFFIPHPNPNGLSHHYPLLTVGWTLFFEFTFYLIFTIILFLPARRRLVILMPLLVACTYLYPWHWPGSSWLRDPVMLEFGLGALIASGYKHLPTADSNKMLSLISILMAISAFVILLFYDGDYFRLFAAGILLVAGLLMEPWFATQQKLNYLGNISYSTYLSHTIVILALAPLTIVIPAQYSGIFTVLIGSMVITLISHLSYLYIERPSNTLCKTLEKRVFNRSV